METAIEKAQSAKRKLALPSDNKVPKKKQRMEGKSELDYHNTF